ncbi:MAG: ADOP family duplicated permease, partial [Gemmatimonadetes bacterium]|nr:ADOP family duplicated permease [Gemmatimonadota bacterium]
PVAVISHGYWQRAFGGDPSVVGQTLSINERPVEVVGVIAPGPEHPEPVAVIQNPDVWLPLRLNLTGQFWNSHMEFRTLARLAPGVTADAASRELASYTPRLIERFPSAYSRTFVQRYAFSPRALELKEAIVGDIARNLWILLAGVGLVLAIASANITNLFLVRAEGRRREVAVRTALGAGRIAVLRHFLAESLVVTGCGVALGLLLAWWGIRSLVLDAPANLPRLEGVGLDAGVLAFTAAIAVVVALALSILPALRHAATLRGLSDLSEGGRSATAGRERQRVRAALVVTQVAFALVLLVGAGLLLESFRRLRQVDPGIDANGVLTVSVAMSPRYDTYEKRWLFSQQLLERVRELPGVVSAGLGPVPIEDSYGCTVQGFPDAEVMQRIADANGTLCAGQTSISDGYFEALAIPLLSGRTLTAADNASPAAGSVVVSQAFARKFWPGEDAIGKQVAPQGRSEGPFYTVVGVAGNVYGGSLRAPPAIAIYYPMVPIPETGGLYSTYNLFVNTAGSDPMALFSQIRAAALNIDPMLPLANPRTMASILSDSMSGLTFTMSLLGSAALAALLLAAVGLYGVMGYLVQRRTGEIGVRMALGAKPHQVQHMVVRGSLRLVLGGVLAGIAIALALSRFLTSLLYDVRPTQPSTYVAAVMLLALVAAVASWLPARRASRVDPVEALRIE